MARKNGSALLIVLGFLSFMVVSAVAFSIYMRSERVPSSVYRRSVQSRHLVKAALARAMSELDDSIRNDRFPGVTDASTSRKVEGQVDDIPQGESVRFADSWYGRVFMPPNPDVKLNGHYDGSLMASHDDTVSVVTLEGLGYLPPPLINDVRFLARGSWSSKWRMFNYGAGRYAYCAVNVSDYPDIVRMLADEARSSGSRVNLSSLFADDFKSKGAGVSEAESFADFVRMRGGTHGSWPFVSMLDYSLAMRDQTISGVNSPFYLWCKGNRSTMYDPGTYTALKQPFVTDSWLPDDPLDAKYVSSIVDLNNRKDDDICGQPFPQQNWMEGGKSFVDIRNSSSPFCFRVATGRTPDGKGGQNKSMLELSFTMLYDYLDRDNMPVSLALPCVERVPMVVAMEAPNFSFQMGVQANQQTPVTTAGAASSVTTVETFYQIDPNVFNSWANTLQARVAFTFPFKRGRQINQNFSARVFYRVFLVANGAQGLRIPNATLRPATDQSGPDWTTPSAFTISGGSSGLAPMVFTFVSDPQTITPPSNIEIQDDAVFDKNFLLKPVSPLPTQTLISKKETTSTPMAGGVPTGPAATTMEWKFDAAPLNADGTVMSVPGTYMPDTGFRAALASINYTLQAAMWVCIEDSNGDVVDLVPALEKDDQLYNNVNNAGYGGYGFDGNGQYPLFRFKSTFASSAGSTPDTFFNVAPTTIDQPLAYFAVDPRYNWAPEDWLPRNKQATAGNWLDWVLGVDSANNTDVLLGADGRDSDIFMFVSNQGFLQSMGELAFLPRVTNFGDQRNAGAVNPTDLVAVKDMYDGVEHNVGDNWNVIPNRDCVWRTFRPYRINDGASEYLMDFRNVFGSARPHAFKDFGVRGFRVNPYTDNEDVLMTAFAYTPYDWWAAAGTNSPNWQTTNSKDSSSARQGMFKELSDSREYSFYEGASESNMRDEDIRAIARTIRNSVRGDVTREWQDVYDSLDWYGEVEPDNEDSFKNFLGLKLGRPLHGVDRKFLYAFWRGCLANRQQLFLVFLRAESMALGGSGEGQIPPQQGGHAVALVWRDPENPLNSSGQRINQDGTTSVLNWVPHRMRVLFFHQFD